MKTNNNLHKIPKQVHQQDLQQIQTLISLILKSNGNLIKNWHTSFRKDTLIITNKKSNLPRELPDNMIYWIRCETKVKDDC
jgi:hypothetical protein